MKKIYLLLALAVGLVSSCDMDTEPYGSIPEEEALMTPDDFTSMRNGLYSGLRSSVGGNTFYTPIEAQSDEFHALVGNSNTFGGMYRWDFTPQNSYVDAVYGNYQAVIARANFIIQGYNSCDFSDTSTFDDEGMAAARAAKGDAYFARAYCIFMLSQYFCADYEESTADNANSGVSYRLDYAPSSDPSTYPARKTLNETYAQIEEDLDSAALYITTAGAISSDRITVDAITALRARAALAKDDYPNAASYAASLVDGGNYILASSVSDLTDLWANDGGMETILQLTIGSTSQLVSGSGTYYQPVDHDYTDFVPTQTVIDLYDANDYRRTAYFNTLNIVTTTGISGTVYGFNKFPLETRLYQASPSTDTRSVIEPKVFRIAEMYLIAAEAYAQDDDLTRAAYYLNELERNRIRGYQDQTFASRDAIMQEIRDERLREMIGEGTRIFDIKRWHIAMERGEAQNESLCLTPGSTTTSLTRPADSDRMTWPIPQNEIDLTDRIVQNPGY
jgi:hypothetical protein